MQIGLLGLGKMGRNIVEKLLADNHEVVVWNRSQEILDTFERERAALIKEGRVTVTRSLDEMKTVLREPQIYWTMLLAGEPTETMLTSLRDTVNPGTIVIDGGNAHYTDTEQRAKQFAKKGIKFLGIGVSGGLYGFTNGYPMMAGGDKDAYEYILPILDSLAKPHGRHTYFGAGGSGHFVKMIHNGIEYGMMQAIAEGLGVIKHSEYQVNVLDVLKNWQSGSIVSSFLIDMAYNALEKDPSLSESDGFLAANGEADWTVQKAKEEGVPITIIEESLEFRKQTRHDKKLQKTFAAKMVGALRHEFGGHAQTKPDKNS